MDLDLTSTLLKSGVPAQREDAARSLGRSLAAEGNGEWLLKFRRLVVRLQKGAASDYERGFLDALELVSVGFERQSSETVVDEQELARIKSRAHWLPTLKLLIKGPMRPLDLSERLQIHKSQVTRLLDDLEDARLVERIPDGKERPCRITPRARVLLDKLPTEEEPIPPGKLVSALVRCFGALTRDQRVDRAWLQRSLEAELSGMASKVLEQFGEALRALSLGGFTDDGAILETEGELRQRVASHVALGCANKPTSLIKELQGLSPKFPLLIRVGESLQEWELLAERMIQGAQVLREKDLRVPPTPQSGPYSVLYESPSLLTEDRRAGRGDLLEMAQQRYCLSVSESPRINNVQMLRVNAPELAA